MVIDFATYNFVQDPNKYKRHDRMIRQQIKDTRNGIVTSNIIPDVQCYVNYTNLLLYVRNKWISTGYLDLGMIPIIMGPSFLHSVLIYKLLPLTKTKGLEIHPMPSTSFLLPSSNLTFEDYWAFRSDVSDFLDVPPEKVTLRAVLEKLMGDEFE